MQRRHGSHISYVLHGGEGSYLKQEAGVSSFADSPWGSKPPSCRSFMLHANVDLRIRFHRHFSCIVGERQLEGKRQMPQRHGARHCYPAPRVVVPEETILRILLGYAITLD